MTANINDSKNESGLHYLLLVIFEPGGGDSQGCCRQGWAASRLLPPVQQRDWPVSADRPTTQSTARQLARDLASLGTKLKSPVLNGSDASLNMTAGMPMMKINLPYFHMI